MVTARRIMRSLGNIAAAFALILLTSCTADQPVEPTVTGLSAAKGGGSPKVKVESTDPSSAEQETTLDVRVLGSGFDLGSEARFLLDGVEVPGVKRNGNTQFVSESELIANITITLDATVDLYDAEVLTFRGKKGVGADLFQVVEKGNPGQSDPGEDFPTIVTFRDDPTDNIRSDDELRDDQLYLNVGGPEYKDDVCGVFANLGNFDDARMDPDRNWPNAKGGKKLRELEAECGERRVLIIDRSVPADALPPDVLLIAGIFSNIDKVLAVTGTDVELSGGFHAFDDDDDTCGRLIFRPFPGFSPPNNSDLLLVSFDDNGTPDDSMDDVWTVRTQDSPKDKAFCTEDGRLWHMPFGMTIKRQ